MGSVETGLRAELVCKDFVVWNGFWGFLHPQRRRVLDAVSAHFPRGAITGLAGANGAGKTTLLKILAGLITPTSGRILLDGVPSAVGSTPMTAGPASQAHGAVASAAGPASTAAGSAWRSRVAITIAESRSFYWRLTCLQNLRFFSALLGRTGTENRIRDVAARLDMTGFLDQRFYQLSSGQMQRMAIARALLADPDVWLLDEPERDLDSAGVAALREEIRRAKMLGRCLVLVTHDEGTLHTLCDPVVHLVQGRVVLPAEQGRTGPLPGGTA